VSPLYRFHKLFPCDFLPK